MADLNETLAAAAAAVAAPAPAPALDSQQQAAAAAQELPDLAATPEPQEGNQLEDNFVQFFDDMTREDDGSQEGEAPLEVQEPAQAAPEQRQTPQATPQGQQQVSGAQQQQQPSPAPASVDPAALAVALQLLQSGQVQIPGQQAQVAQTPQQQQPQAQAASAATAAADAQRPVDPFAVAAENLRQGEAAFVERLAKEVYTVDPEQFQQVLGGDPSALGTLCARVHANAVSSVMRTVSAYLPVYVNGLIQANQTSQEKEDAFWQANPHLKKAEHRNLLPPVIQMVNQMQPNADEATRYRMIGMMVALANGIPLQAQAPNGSVQPQTQTRQVAPKVKTPGPVVKATPKPAFSPAGGPAGGAPQQQYAPYADNMWSRMTDYYMAEDKGQLDAS